MIFNDGDGNGTIVVDEHIYQVVDVHLDMGAFVVHGRTYGPYQIAGGNYGYMIFDRSGVLVARGRMSMDHMLAHEGDFVDLFVRCSVQDKLLEDPQGWP